MGGGRQSGGPLRVRPASQVAAEMDMAEAVAAELARRHRLAQLEEEYSWTYNQRTGQLRHPGGRLDPDRGYSGAPGYVNDPTSEHLRDRGPIPRGLWSIGAAYESARGPLTLDLQPEGHNALGRTGMQVHGDRENNLRVASQGCIILNRRQREALRDSEVRWLNVVDAPEWHN